MSSTTLPAGKRLPAPDPLHRGPAPQRDEQAQAAEPAGGRGRPGMTGARRMRNVKTIPALSLGP